MKPITRNLFTYQADILAAPALIEERLPVFAELGEHQRAGDGFVPVVPNTDARVLTFPGGWAICYREDSKILPTATINKAIEEKTEAIKQATGRKPGKMERNEIKADVMYDLLGQAFTRTKLTVAAYSTRTNRLYVNTGAQKTSDALCTALVHALESVKFSTVHVSDPAQGLTARLVNWLNDGEPDDCFGDFEPHTEVIMSSDGRQWAVKLDNLREAEPALRNALERGASVASIRFMADDLNTSFRVSKSLRLQGVRHPSTFVENDPEVDAKAVDELAWQAQLTLEIGTLDTVMDGLCHLLRPEKAQGAEGGDLFGEA